MSGTTINKVDMSLDDIIKLNKKNKAGVSPLNRQGGQKGKGGAARRGGGAAGAKSNQNNGQLRRVGGNQSGRVNKKYNANTQQHLQKKRLDALKKLREAKQTLAMLNNNTTKNSSMNRNRGSQNLSTLSQHSSQQQNRQRIRRNYGNAPNQNRQQNLGNNNQKPRINRNYGSNLSLAQLGNTSGKLNKKFSASNISLASFSSNSNNVSYNQQNQQKGKRNQYLRNNNNQSLDNTLTVSVPNISTNRRRNNRKQQKFNFPVKPENTQNYEFDTNAFSSLGTNVPLTDRFSGSGSRNRNDNAGRQVYY